MSDQEVVLSDDVQAQISKLDGIGDLLQKYMRPAMQQSVSLLAGAVEPNIPTLTGYARETFGTHVLNGSGLNMTGYVGWKGSPTAWWMNIVESGARPHPLVPGFTSRRGPGKAGWAGMQKLGVTPLGEHVKIGDTVGNDAHTPGLRRKISTCRTRWTRTRTQWRASSARLQTTCWEK